MSPYSELKVKDSINGIGVSRGTVMNVMLNCCQGNITAKELVRVSRQETGIKIM